MTNDAYVDQMLTQWRSRSTELAQWIMSNLVNRTDVWGRYLSKRHRKGEFGSRNSAITAPFREESPIIKDSGRAKQGANSKPHECGHYEHSHAPIVDVSQPKRPT